jgi:hypothetical protein
VSDLAALVTRFTITWPSCPCDAITSGASPFTTSMLAVLATEPGSQRIASSTTSTRRSLDLRGSGRPRVERGDSVQGVQRVEDLSRGPPK